MWGIIERTAVWVCAAGLLTFEYQQLAPVEWPGLRVTTQLPVPGDDSAERLAVRHYLV